MNRANLRDPTYSGKTTRIFFHANNPMGSKASQSLRSVSGVQDN